MDFVGSAAEVFVIEAKDLLFKMEEVLLKIENGEQNSDFINNIFRSAHTLKGSAAMFNFSHLTELAHEIENLLSIFRATKTAINKPKITILLETIDCLANLLDESVKGIVSPEIIKHKEELIKKLKQDETKQDPDQINIDQHKEQNLTKSNLSNLDDVVSITKDNFIKVGFNKLDQIVNLVGELFIAQSYLNNVIKYFKLTNEKIANAMQHSSKLIDDLRTVSLQLRMLPIKEIVSKFNRVVRDLSVSQKKQIKLEIVGGETELDKFIVEKINEPLLHLIRNACEHGIGLPSDRITLGKSPCGTITLTAKQENNEVVVIIKDDGRGIDLNKVKEKAMKIGLLKDDINLSKEELISLIFYPGVSTAEKVTELSGRGVGMDIVKKEIDKLHGTIAVKTEDKQGTTIFVRLPLTLAIIDGLLFKLNDLFFIIPMWNVVECIDISFEEHQSVAKNNYFNFRDKILPGVILTDTLGISCAATSSTAIIVQHADYKVAIVIESLQGEIQTIIKPIPEFFYNSPWAGGAAVLGEGEIAIILDIPKLIIYLLQKNKNNFNKANYV